jgi:hypothetical protein
MLVVLFSLRDIIERYYQDYEDKLKKNILSFTSLRSKVYTL